MSSVFRDSLRVARLNLIKARSRRQQVKAAAARAGAACDCPVCWMGNPLGAVLRLLNADSEPAETAPPSIPKH